MRLTKCLFAMALALGLASPALRAQAPAQQEYPGLETGKMWTFDVPPLEYWATRYNFRPSTVWLDHVRQSALRQSGSAGCTASFVSADGLIMTNHHCARGCIDGVTRQGEDFLTNGFYAATRAEERACGPNVWVDQLVAITDVTDSVNAAVPAGAAATRAADLRAEAIRGLEQRCSAGQADVACQVVTMYRGGQYKLYRFRRYRDIRLVFAPEGQVTFFGGDPDNFTYPRHDLDMSFYRAYVNGQPAHPEHYFRWSRNGSNEGDLIFVVGNPGSTNRLNTVAWLEYQRDVAYPARLAQFGRMITILHAISDADPQRGAGLRNMIFGIENSQKASQGELRGLQDPQLMQQKRAWETDFRNRVNADANLRRQFGDPWAAIANIRRQMAQMDVRRRYHTFNAYNTRYLNFAGMLVRASVEAAKPDSARLPQFRDAARANFERMLNNPAPVDTMLEGRMLAAFLSAMASELPATDPVRRAALGGRSPEEAANAMLAATQLGSVEQRRALLQGGAAAIAASTDPFIQWARVVEPLQREIDRQYTELANQEAQNDEKIARALLAVYGNSVAPDATFSLRIQDGQVMRYPYNGTWAQPYTTFAGLYDRWAGFGGRAPWDLPDRWIQRRDSLNLLTPLNGVSTNDIIGGNSGSPVVNRDGEIVGLAFDGNIESLSGRFLYSERGNRTVWVDSRGIIEALRRMYGAGAMADELTGSR